MPGPNTLTEHRWENQPTMQQANELLRHFNVQTHVSKETNIDAFYLSIIHELVVRVERLEAK
jgi:hypothetical protein